MTTNGRRLLVASLIAAGAVSPRCVQACSCVGPRPVAELLANAHVVCVAEAVRVERAEHPWGRMVILVRGLWSEFTRRDDPYLDDWYHSSRYGYVVSLRIIEGFKGMPAATGALHTGEGNGGDCGYRFTAGESYLVYAFWEKDSLKPGYKFLETSVCSGTTPLESAADDVAELRRLVAR